MMRRMITAVSADAGGGVPVCIFNLRNVFTQTNAVLDSSLRQYTPPHDHQ